MPRGGPAGHRAALEALGLPAAACAALTTYLDAVAAWSPRANLTGARDPEARVRVLVASVLPALPLLEPGRLIDVGSGNGSPGLVLALLRPELPATLLEPRLKRWAFLREAVRASGRGDIEVLRLRHDEYRGAPAQTLTLRALRLPLSALAPLAAAGGRLLVFGPAPQAWRGFREEAPAPAGLSVWRRCST